MVCIMVQKTIKVNGTLYVNKDSYKSLPFDEIQEISNNFLPKVFTQFPPLSKVIEKPPILSMERDLLLGILDSEGLDVSAVEIFLKNMEDFYAFLTKSVSTYNFSPKFLTRPDFYIIHQVDIFKYKGEDCVKLLNDSVLNSKHFLFKESVEVILNHFLIEKKTTTINQRAYVKLLDNSLMDYIYTVRYDDKEKMFYIGCKKIELHVFEGACVALGLLKYER